MTYSEQTKWLSDNGFVDVPTPQQNMIFWAKKLEANRELQFVWHNRGPNWEIIIYGDIDDRFSSDVWLVDSIPTDADFNQFQPLIDIIK
jgi:predicted nucleotide-binding protein (sugar kinase/HSP70/actin superfamily)